MRIRLTPQADPMWEIVGSLHRIQARDGGPALAQWRRKVRDNLSEVALLSSVRTLLNPLLPRARYFPDFLTPTASGDGLDSGIEAILDTPPSRVRTELEILRRHTGSAAGLDGLARGDLRSLRHLGRVVAGYHHAALADDWPAVESTVQNERAVLTHHLAAGGVEAMFAALPSGMRWRPPVLEVAYAAGDQELHLRGRGLTLIPSHFCRGTPITLADPDLPPVLVYPARRPPRRAPDPADPLTGLLGRTRAHLLRLIAAAPGCTTGQLATRTGVSASTVSEHTTILRRSGLIDSVRHTNLVMHRLTHNGELILQKRID
ncbi:winged helix-turn-helix domain-containing protein [Streptosporangium canum]|uniref:winged helix-turn-helix domain-containing protein n=1 Tax=Streptosporangium canum TaxID=324952 RepID=UPI00379B591F